MGWLISFAALLAVKMVYAAPFAFVTNLQADLVSIFDLATHAVIGYVDNAGFIISHPIDVRHSPDGTKAYLVADFSNAVFVIDTQTNAIVKQVDSSAFPFNAPTTVQFSPDGTKAYVSNENGNNISIIDTSTDTIIGYVHDNGYAFKLPVDIAFSPNGILAYVTNYNGNTISVIDVASNTATGYINTGSFYLLTPSYVSFVDDTKAYVCFLNSNQVGIIDVAHGVMTGYVNPGPFSFVLPHRIMNISDSGRAIITNIGSNQVIICAIDTDTVLGAAGPLNNPRQMAISPDHSTVFIANKDGNSVSILNLATNTIEGIIDAAHYPFHVPIAISIAPNS